MYKIASTRRLVIPNCPNCGNQMELLQGKTKDSRIYLFWYCDNSISDDACETNGDVLPEVNEDYEPKRCEQGGKTMDYFDYKNQRELEMETNKHGLTTDGEKKIKAIEKRIQEIENRIQELENHFNTYVRQKDDS